MSTLNWNYNERTVSGITVGVLETIKKQTAHILSFNQIKEALYYEDENTSDMINVLADSVQEKRVGYG